MEELKKFFNAVDVALIHIDHESQRFIYVNEYFIKLMGYDEETLLNKNFTDFIHPEDKERTLDFVKEGILGNIDNRYVNRFVNGTSGEVLTLLWFTNNASFDGTGKYCTAFCLNMNIVLSELKKEVDKKNVYKTLLSILHD